ncbi:citrate synthase [Anaerofilum sp. BX8]|uniref:Citrate synthase n=1 Tax=Anaerofilum hominis TaxID=2763016 RepID=A0A923KY32_9FIRM|nr:citrate synthase [Anaerofilum hominis]
MSDKLHSLEYLCEEYLKNNYIDPEMSEKLGVKRGLRNPDGTGVLAGLTNVCDVVGYDMIDGVRTPRDGQLIYRGIDVQDIVKAAYAEDRFIFEEVIWLLLFGSLPTAEELADFKVTMEESRGLPENFVEDMIIKAPSPNIMNKMQRSVLALYSYDDDAEIQTLKNILRQSVVLISSLPTIMVNAYQVKRRVYDKKSMYFHMPKPGQSTAEHILRTYRADRKFTHEEAKLLDLCMVLHADHGGGNNSTFACRVLSSTGTDTYSAIAAGIGSLKGPKHGGANIKVMEMLDDIKANVRDYDDDTEIKEYLRRLIRKQAGDRSGLIYGIGHAVYTKSDPRAVILRTNAEHLAYEQGFGDDFKLLCAVERLAPQVFAEEKGNKNVCANVDLYSGLIYRMLGLSVDLYTPLFAISRIPGWCAHRIEEVVFANRIIRPAYKYLGVRQRYVSLEDRR